MDKNITIYMKQKGFEKVRAVYNIEDKSVKILKGSNVSEELYAVRFKRIRKKLEDAGYLKDGCFVKDYLVERKNKENEFKTALSTAAGIILGRQSTGPKEFYTLVDEDRIFMSQFLIDLYIEEHIDDDCDFTLEKQKDLRDEFQQYFSIEKFKTLKYQEYHALKEVNENNLMYLLEYDDRYSKLGYVPLAGDVDKCGFYQSGKNETKDYYYFDEKLSKDEIDQKWEVFRNSIYELLNKIKDGNPEELKNVDSKLEKISSVVIKLASIYFPETILQISVKSGIEILFNLLIGETSNSSIFYKSMKVREYLDNRYPDEDPVKLSQILYEYYVNKYVKGVDVEMDNKNYWIISAGENAKLWEYFKAGNLIAVGWNEVGDLSKLKTKKAIKNKYESLKDGDHKNDIKALWDFYNNMKNGDVVFVKKGENDVLGYGEISGDYEYDPSFEYHHKRKVIWKSLDAKKVSNEMRFTKKTLTKLEERNEQMGYLLDCYESSDDHENKEYNEIDKYQGKNTIFYGVPGCGKSRMLDKVVLEGVGAGFKKRVLFHPEYTYSDFVGQTMPVVRDGKITYEFVPGPFTEILKQAIKDKSLQENYYLIIEEINRGNAPAIFGDLFQLLDRKNGRSEYEITNKAIADWVYKDTENFGKDSVYIPSNLTLFATMNTCDQNVFTMDTAFKRRWKMVRVKNGFDDNECASFLNWKIDGLPFTWKEFATVVNDLILKCNDGVNAEDKQLGAYFVKEDEITDINAFAEKVLMYLWEDVVRYDKTQMFDSRFNTLDKVISGFCIGENVFVGDEMAKLYSRMSEEINADQA